MAGRVAGIAFMTRRLTGNTAVMHQHRNRHRLRDGLAAMLADVGNQFLSAMRIVGAFYRLTIGLHHSVSTTL